MRIPVPVNMLFLANETRPIIWLITLKTVFFYIAYTSLNVMLLHYVFLEKQAITES